MASRSASEQAFSFFGQQLMTPSSVGLHAFDLHSLASSSVSMRSIAAREVTRPMRVNTPRRGIRVVAGVSNRYVAGIIRPTVIGAR